MTKEEDYAKRLLAKADKYLAEVDDAYIIQQRGHKRRPMPTFGAHELTLGKTLGMGGFGIVSEVSNFTLDPDPPPDSTDDCPTQQQQQPVPTPATSNHPSSENPQQPKHSKNTDSPTADEEDNNSQEQQEEEEQDDTHANFDVDRARRYMAQRCMRRGSARYALKKLHGCLSAVERARGMVDLAVEAKYLSVVLHPNISEYQTK